MNNKSRQPSAGKPDTAARTPAKAKQRDTQGDDLQPADTGSSGGSPAAPVMKQSAKTKAEGTGKA